jgi:hypothetical protein
LCQAMLRQQKDCIAGKRAPTGSGLRKKYPYGAHSFTCKSNATPEIPVSRAIACRSFR